MAETYERKEIKLPSIKLAAPSAPTGEFSGYLAAYGNIDSGDDVLEPGCFSEYLAEMKATGDWPSLLLNHGGWNFSADDLLPIGIHTDLSEDDYGLKFVAALADTQRGSDVYKLMQMKPRPAIKGMSIGWIPDKYSFHPHPTKNGRQIRRVQKAELVEGSVVTFPMNKRATVRDVKSGIPDIRIMERALRDAGLSREEAKAVLAEGWKGIPQRDAGQGTNAELAALIRRNIQTLTPR